MIVFTTGFVSDMRQLIGAIVGPKIEDQLDDYWGIDKEGELRGAFKPMGRTCNLSHFDLLYLPLEALAHRRFFSLNQRG